MTGESTGLGYFLWPVTPVPDGGSQSFVGVFLALERTLQILGGIVLTGIGLLVWLINGMPGLKDLISATDLESNS